MLSGGGALAAPNVAVNSCAAATLIIAIRLPDLSGLIDDLLTVMAFPSAIETGAGETLAYIGWVSHRAEAPVDNVSAATG